MDLCLAFVNYTLQIQDKQIIPSSKFWASISVGEEKNKTSHWCSCLHPKTVPKCLATHTHIDGCIRNVCLKEWILTEKQFAWFSDGEGVKLRARNQLCQRICSSQDPNYIWHINIYGKLKQYDIEISGCIDGFVKIIWLDAWRISNGPHVIVGELYDCCYRDWGTP